jgi:hypothetical protein
MGSHTTYDIVLRVLASWGTSDARLICSICMETKLRLFAAAGGRLSASVTLPTGTSSGGGFCSHCTRCDRDGFCRRRCQVGRDELTICACAQAKTKPHGCWTLATSVPVNPAGQAPEVSQSAHQGACRPRGRGWQPWVTGRGPPCQKPPRSRTQAVMSTRYDQRN